MTRNSDAIAAELEEADYQMKRLADKIHKLRSEWNSARVAEASAKPHLWLGKRVTKKVSHGYRGGTRKVHGTVTIYDREKHRGLRNIYRAEPGDLFVLNDSGLTGYHWMDYSEKEPGWKLA